ncbi:ankyrin repeat domain-containing protein [Flavobacterium sp.]|uniref:ankyrin repeat domain-containing protein n=1 Tax=Flavobacterium sp. TaxID=239 RepID=UPI002FD8F5EC
MSIFFRNSIYVFFLFPVWLFTSAQIQPKTEADRALLAASLHGDVQGIKKAMKDGANVNIQDAEGFTPLNRSAKLSYYHLVYYFVELGADVTIPNYENITPLHYGVEYNNIKIVKLLLENGADIDARDKITESPLHWAGWTGNYEAAKLLLKHGANPYAKNNTGVTPIDLTIRQEHKKLEKLFKRKKYQKFKNKN